MGVLRCTIAVDWICKNCHCFLQCSLHTLSSFMMKSLFYFALASDETPWFVLRQSSFLKIQIVFASLKLFHKAKKVKLTV